VPDVSLAIAPHAALQDFRVVQETSGERGNRTLLARSKGGSLVVVKILAERAIPEDQTSQLSKIASQSAKLGDPVIVQARSMILEKDFAAVVTEFVPGVSLQRLLRFAAGRGVRLPDACAFYILERLLTALAHAHASTVVHRSVSPSSVVVGWDGTVKVGDFGLVQMRQVFRAGAPPKSERDVAPLMSPEETRGERPDARSDVYCAALVAVRLATGRTPYARFRKVPSERILAMSEGQVARLGQTRPDLPAALREALDAALEPERDKRAISAEALLAKVREHAPTSKAALAKLLGRWREALEASLTPWERRASMSDELPEEDAGLLEPGALSLATPDERPSDGALVSGDATSDEPWRKGAVPAEEAALAPTDPTASLSRLGSVAPDALVMPLPAMRITMPELPTYGGEPVNVTRPPPKPSVFSGGVGAAVVATMFVVLVGGAIILFRWLLKGP